MATTARVVGSLPVVGDDLADAFLLAFRHYPAGVTILAAQGPDGPVALTISSLISVSRTPPLVAFSLSQSSKSAQAIGCSDHLVIHFVDHDNLALAQLCASPGKDRFGPDVIWGRLDTGEPCYPEIQLRFRATVRERFPVPGATLVVAELTAASRPGETFQHDLAIYANRGWHRLGREAGPRQISLWPEDSVTF